MNRFIKYIHKTTMKKFYTETLLKKTAYSKKGVLILMYHSITDNNLSTYPYAIKKEHFEEQIRFLSENFNMISLNQGFEMLKNNDNMLKNKPYCIITFDDGFKNNYTVAYPILCKYNAPFTIFLTTNYIDQNNESYLNWEDVLKMCQNPLANFGAHTLNHMNLNALEKKDIENEIIQSKEIIESKLSKKVDFFAYPGGSHNQTAVNIVKNNFIAGLKDRIGNDHFNYFALDRISIDKKNENFKEFLVSLALSNFLTPGV